MFCSHCGKQLAASGSFCPHCGAPIDGSSAPAAVPPVTVRNVYAGKREQIVGNLVGVAGILICLSGGLSNPPSPAALGFGLLLLLAGIAIYTIGRFSHWYHAE